MIGNTMKSRIIWQDYVLAAAIIFQWATLLMTRYVLFSLPVAAEVAIEIEKNPVLREEIDKEYTPFLINLMSEGAIIAGYLYLRRLVKQGKADILILNTILFAYFTVQSNAFANDFGIFLKIITEKVGL